MGPDKFFFFDTTVDYKHFTSVQVIFLKKYFGSLENGCIFASAFEKKRCVERDTRKREKFEINEKIEIACVNLHIRYAEDTKTSQ